MWTQVQCRHLGSLQTYIGWFWVACSFVCHPGIPLFVPAVAFTHAHFCQRGSSLPSGSCGFAQACHLGVALCHCTDSAGQSESFSFSLCSVLPARRQHGAVRHLVLCAGVLRSQVYILRGRQSVTGLVMGLDQVQFGHMPRVLMYICSRCMAVLLV